MLDRWKTKVIEQAKSKIKEKKGLSDYSQFSKDLLFVPYLVLMAIWATLLYLTYQPHTAGILTQSVVRFLCYCFLYYSFFQLFKSSILKFSKDAQEKLWKHYKSK